MPLFEFVILSGQEFFDSPCKVENWNVSTVSWEIFRSKINEIVPDKSRKYTAYWLRGDLKNSIHDTNSLNKMIRCAMKNGASIRIYLVPNSVQKGNASLPVSAPPLYRIPANTVNIPVDPTQQLSASANSGLAEKSIDHRQQISLGMTQSDPSGINNDSQHMPPPYRSTTLRQENTLKQYNEYVGLGRNGEYVYEHPTIEKLRQLGYTQSDTYLIGLIAFAKDDLRMILTILNTKKAT